MEKVNIAEILKDCPIGMELDCAIFNDVTLYRIDTFSENEYPIRIETKKGNFLDLTKYGTYSNVEESKCVIFPKGKTSWKGFVPPCKFKDGDVIYNPGIKAISILKSNDSEKSISYVFLNILSNLHIYHYHSFDLSDWRLATEEEKAKLFDAIKENGYKWNEETKTLEKLIEPKFKVGDRIKAKDDYKKYITGGHVSTITSIKDGKYWSGNFTIEYINEQDKWELDKFDITTLVPFESRVLMRSSNAREWVGTIYSHYNNNYFFGCGMMCQQCIPYEGNEHLLGTTDDCDEFYKTWE